MIITDDAALAAHAKHLTTTAKMTHPFEFVHDEVGYNYRLPNLNAALGCAQMERLPEFLAVKADLTQRYAEFFDSLDIAFMRTPLGTTSNNWLNAIVLKSQQEHDAFIEFTNSRGVMTRPIWRLMSRLAMFSHCQHDGLANSLWLEDRVVNIPSSVPDGALSPFNAKLL
jgi:dTDP-4-amino-4,6-dideoxygalactose transaminase